MRALLPLLILALGACAATPPTRAGTSYNLGVNVVDGDVRGYYLGLSSYYGYDEPYIARLHHHYHIPYAEIPVVFYYARLLDLDPLIIVRLRVGGWRWYDIGRHYHLPPHVYYYALPSHYHHWGPIAPFYRYPRHDWGHIYLQDADVVELVNLRYVSHHYGYAPERYIDRRRHGHDHVYLDREIRHEHGPGRARFEPRGIWDRNAGRNDGYDPRRDHGDPHDADRAQERHPDWRREQERNDRWRDNRWQVNPERGGQDGVSGPERNRDQREHGQPREREGWVRTPPENRGQNVDRQQPERQEPRRGREQREQPNPAFRLDGGPERAQDRTPPPRHVGAQPTGRSAPQAEAQHRQEREEQREMQREARENRGHPRGESNNPGLRTEPQ